MRLWMQKFDLEKLSWIRIGGTRMMMMSVSFLSHAVDTGGLVVLTVITVESDKWMEASLMNGRCQRVK